MVHRESAHFEKLEHVISDVVIGKPRVEYFEVDVVNVFRDQAWNLGSRIANHVQQGYNIRTSGQVLQNLDFPLDLLLLDGLEDFDDTLFVVDDVNALEDLSTGVVGVNTCFQGRGIVERCAHLGILSPPYFPDNLVMVLRSPLDL
jgi:hypothetical protein